MSDNPAFDYQTITKQIADRLQERRCRGIRVKGMKNQYPETEPVAAVDGSGKSAFPDLTTTLPSYIISICNTGNLAEDEKMNSFRILSSYCLKTFRTFVIVGPRTEHEQLKKKLKELKIKPAYFIWV
ncbi:MAG: hypothetical protein ACHQRM_01825 [Bacteroidia bacterium]